MSVSSIYYTLYSIYRGKRKEGEEPAPDLGGVWRMRELTRGTGRPNLSLETIFSGADGDRVKNIFPVQQDWQLHRLMPNLLYVMTIRTYMHTICEKSSYLCTSGFLEAFSGDLPAKALNEYTSKYDICEDLHDANDAKRGFRGNLTAMAVMGHNS